MLVIFLFNFYLALPGLSDNGHGHKLGKHNSISRLIAAAKNGASSAVLPGQLTAEKANLNPSSLTERRFDMKVVRKDKPGGSSSSLAATTFNVPIPGKPEPVVKPPLIFNIEKPGTAAIEFVETPGIEIAVTPIPKPVPVPSKPLIIITDGTNTLFQIPLFPEISFSNPFANFSIENWKPLEIFNFTEPEPGIPQKPKPLFGKILAAIQKVQSKVIEVTGLGSILPNSTTMENYGNSALRVLKYLMMDSPF